jgi:hypothetical protein
MDCMYNDGDEGVSKASKIQLCLDLSKHLAPQPESFQRQSVFSRRLPPTMHGKTAVSQQLCFEHF